MQWRSPPIERALASVARWLETRGETPLYWPPSLELLAALFELSRFEAELLLLCAAAELEPAAAAGLALAQGEGLAFPTFGFALARHAEPSWDALTPHAPLRRWELLALAPGPTLLASALRIDERVLHFLLGATAFEPRLAAYVTPLPEGAPLVDSHRAIAERIGALWAGSTQLIQLTGPDSGAKRAIVAAAADGLGWRPYVWSAAALPEAGELDRLLRLWQREAALSRAVLALDAERIETPAEQFQVERMADRIAGPLFILSRQRWSAQTRPALAFEVARPSRAEQVELWRASLRDDAVARAADPVQVAAHFDFSADSIHAAARAWRASPELSLWSSCRERARVSMEGLAQSISPRADWSDLVLDEDRKALLRAIAAQFRNRARVHDEWRLAARGGAGLGITALFAGPSGTGKSLAAEVVAGALDLDLCRVDLSQLVSKYIGETEKNMSRVFEAAEQGGAVLLFDEADALFGKRSEVKDSHDRHANIEVSYLLQRMEAYRGLAILTTNLADNIDAAFLRRLRFVVQFPLPEAREREAIWRGAFPAAAPLKGIDYARLARLQIAGGNIRNIAVLGLFLAADRDSAVTMPLLLEAARVEYAKIERSLRDFETEGWA
ncbi:ATP-binding protein [uncultured Rhodoblastus sp.]|uniref:ATP-binding protein n=1 Tax=uncultured Rhodoblastus sp. TaxID=543037 RepID=UPI0025D567E5|nr:ATP-binding protein [uncultured Rhodoblastus sp.]